MSWLSRVASAWSRRPQASGDAEPTGDPDATPGEAVDAGKFAEWEALLADETPVVGEPDPQAPVVAACVSEEQMLADVIERSGEDVGLRGFLDENGVEQMIQMVRRNGRSGRLWVRTPDELFDFQLHQGRIARVQVIGPRHRSDRLGETLVEMGFLEPEVVVPYLAPDSRPGTPLGVALVDDGHITREQLQEAIAVQTVTRLMRAMEAGRGAYAFKRTTWDLVGPPGGVDVDPFDLLEGAEADNDREADPDRGDSDAP